MCITTIDHNGATDKAFAIAGCNDTDAKSATTILTTPGFTGNEHPRECLSFWYNLKVCIILFIPVVYSTLKLISPSRR